ncbi:GNAT family N-acetyltransferase (plasmid) [Cytobacillus spongiae]|uniref:GNAT family N-acetyltransferase n=1 Tax=Cytobacillus spongiae TaxID=2901381 RepID=UPI00145D349A|nr:GNAT family N-acetyltransferase [Cytobacillus spongiae]NMH70952.1 GNAT family N-acetyltransferase [Bacillus sp. RO3]UII58246.1 GNAT family N-acetyltransferase [Cytobacillus spongiae]
MKLRKAEKRDERLLQDWLNDPTVSLLTTGKELFSTEIYEKWLDAEDQHGYILQIDDQPLAYGEIWVDEEERDLELAHLIVHPHYRNKGIGKQLIEKLEEESRCFPFPWIYMRVVPENLIAIHCYIGAGFKEDESLRDSFDSKWIWFKKRNVWSFL